MKQQPAKLEKLRRQMNEREVNQKNKCPENWRIKEERVVFIFCIICCCCLLCLFKNFPLYFNWGKKIVQQQVFGCGFCFIIIKTLLRQELSQTGIKRQISKLSFNKFLVYLNLQCLSFSKVFEAQKKVVQERKKY